jgi:hypothetical protein
MAEILSQDINLYRRLGLTPIPLRQRSKEPLVKWGNGWNPTREELRACASLSPELPWLKEKISRASPVQNCRGVLSIVPCGGPSDPIAKPNTVTFFELTLISS